ncbi:MAG: thiamine phosphate synthase [Sulfurovum sp.]|nr:MAG: thiamine phosphate synthase [Sulfurovum sp.]
MIAYAISDPCYLNPNDPHPYLGTIAPKADFFLYRDKGNFNYMYDAKKVVEAARSYPFKKILLHRDIWLVPTLGADGVHLSSEQIEEIAKAKSLGIYVIFSAHSIDDAQRAEALGADAVTLSPIYETPDKGEPIGTRGLGEVVTALHIPVIALGGIIDKEKIEACQNAGASGFASIRYFVTKR